MVKVKSIVTVKCPKCNTRMVKQADTYVFASLAKEPTGGVSFSLTDTVTSRLYVCPKCHFMEFYYERE